MSWSESAGPTSTPVYWVPAPPVRNGEPGIGCNWPLALADKTRDRVPVRRHDVGFYIHIIVCLTESSSMREKRWTGQAYANKRQKRDILLHRFLNRVSDSFRRHTQVRSALVGVAMKKKVTVGMSD